ncbi:MAG: hypothetical protein ACKO7W_02040 [Elainella sp.]
MRQFYIFTIGLNLTISLFFFYLFYIRYWKWRDCINQALSSCITPDGDSLISGGMFWAVPGLFFLGIAVTIFLVTRRRNSRF